MADSITEGFEGGKGGMIRKAATSPLPGRGSAKVLGQEVDERTHPRRHQPALRHHRMDPGVGQRKTGQHHLKAGFDIAAFNLGNAIGAWLGGMVIVHGPGLGAVPWVAALLTVAGLAVAWWSVRLDQAGPKAPSTPATLVPISRTA
ncbi:MFS transporter [Luteimonas sp. MC1828]|nr:MFS transporter [Luteimonas sp. MC1828]